MTLQLRAMTDQDIARFLVATTSSEDARQWLATLVSDADAFSAVAELRRRYRDTSIRPPRLTPTGRQPHASTVMLDRDRWRSYFFRRRLNLSEVGPLIGRCSGWASVLGSKGHAGLWALDELACALGVNLDDLIYEVGTDEERERLSVMS